MRWGLLDFVVAVGRYPPSISGKKKRQRWGFLDFAVVVGRYSKLLVSP